MNEYKMFKINMNKHFQKKLNNKKDKCNHPNCNEKAIGSHTVSKASNLLKISDINNCVYSIENPIFNINNNDLINFKKIGKNEASKYHLFCKKHDETLFEPFEKNNTLKITQKHCFLLHYRILNKALYLKQILHNAYEKTLEDMNKLEEIVKTENLKIFIDKLEYISKIIGIESKQLISQKEELDKLLMKRDYSNQSYYAIIINEIPEIQCSSTWIPMLDFNNNELFDLDNHNLHIPSISIDILAYEDKGIILFTWNNSNEYTYSESSVKFIKSLDNIANTEKFIAILYLIFGFNENIFISPTWFDKLDSNKQEILKQIQIDAINNLYTLGNYNVLKDFINWNIIDIKTNINDLEVNY